MGGYAYKDDAVCSGATQSYPEDDEEWGEEEVSSDECLQPAHEVGGSEQSAARSRSQAVGASNMAAAEALSDQHHTETNVEFGEQSGVDFVEYAGYVLDGLVPGHGCSASMMFGVTFKLPLNVLTWLSFDLRCTAEAARGPSGQLDVGFNIAFGVIVDVGKAPKLAWLPKFAVSLSAYIKGGVRGSGDSGAEAVHQLVYMICTTVYGSACEAGASKEHAGCMANGLMSPEDVSELIAGWDQDDEAVATYGVEVGVGMKTNFGTVGASVEYSRSTKVVNQDDDPSRLETKHLAGLKVAATFTMKKTRTEVPCAMLLQWSEDVLDMSMLTVGIKYPIAASRGGMKSAVVASMVDLVNALSNTVSAIYTQSNEPRLQKLLAFVNGVQPTQNVLDYGVGIESFGVSAEGAADTTVDNKDSMKNLAVAAHLELGWSQQSGYFLRVIIRTDETLSVGKQGETPFYGEISSGDTILSLEVNKSDGFSASS